VCNVSNLTHFRLDFLITVKATRTTFQLPTTQNLIHTKFVQMLMSGYIDASHENTSPVSRYYYPCAPTSEVRIVMKS
jgi:hypothetical protein